MWHLAPDESVLDSSGRIIFFSLPRFISNISEGDDCFICGAKPNTVPFNNEHVLPDWILRRYQLHDKAIQLSNRTRIPYRELKIPCCEDCNRTMGDKFEKPISEMFAKGPTAISQEFEENGPWRVFCWMALIFVKTHLKDKYLRLHRDYRKGEMKIGELHSWEDLHHIHCVARAFHTGARLSLAAIGSMLIVPAKVRSHFESFDYVDLSFAQTMLLRIDETALFAVFDDSQAVLSVFYEDLLHRIQGPVSPLQAREMAARFAAINIHLAERPRFSSSIDLLSEEYAILGHRPNEWRIGDWKDETQGLIMHHVCKDTMVGMVDMPDREQLLEKIKTGRYTFLLDGERKFIHDHMDLVPKGKEHNSA
jgi:hypothetical protein